MTDHIPDGRELADALEKADWSNTSIGNKILIKGAIEILRSSALPKQAENQVQFCTHPDYSDWDGSGPEPRPKQAEPSREALHRSFADAVCTIEGVANALRHNPKIDPDQIRHDLLLNVRLYREAAKANGIDIRKIKPHDEPYNFNIEQDGHAALDRRLAAQPADDGVREATIRECAGVAQMWASKIGCHASEIATEIRTLQQNPNPGQSQ